MLKFDKLLWEKDLQSLVCANFPTLAEMWFRDFEDCHVAVCFLNSGSAQELLDLTNGDPDKASKLIIEQLSIVLDIALDEMHAAHVDTRIHIWDVGYMFPKVGLKQMHLDDLAKPHQNMYFAGEATHTGACCTVQAAMETGIRAARQILEVNAI